VKDKSLFNAQSIDFLGKTAGYLKALFEEMIFYNACIESKYYSKKFANYTHLYFHNEEKINHLIAKNESLDKLIQLL
jgi:hypothetical protein